MENNLAHVTICKSNELDEIIAITDNVTKAAKLMQYAPGGNTSKGSWRSLKDAADRFPAVRLTFWSLVIGGGAAFILGAVGLSGWAVVAAVATITGAASIITCAVKTHSEINSSLSILEERRNAEIQTIHDNDLVALLKVPAVQSAIDEQRRKLENERESISGKIAGLRETVTRQFGEVAPRPYDVKKSPVEIKNAYEAAKLRARKIIPR